VTVRIETYYDFRSPYAYFADYRVRKGDLGFASNVEWVGRPVFIDVILNLQAGHEPWASYVDTLIPPKRAYLMADIRRVAEFYGAPHPTGRRGNGRPGRTRFRRYASHRCCGERRKNYSAAPSSTACGTNRRISLIQRF
jgi:2-hydroxychromene-2-carboxylate isomerase